jgi:hypothetical protein
MAKSFNPSYFGVLGEDSDGGQPGHKVHKIPSQPMACHSGTHLSSQLHGEAQKGWVIMVQAGPGLKPASTITNAKRTEFNHQHYQE